MVEAEFGGDYLSTDTSKDGDLWTIKEKPVFGTLTFQGKEKKVTNIIVSGGTNLTQLTYTPTNKAGKALVKAWGKEMDNWVGKRFETLHIGDRLVIRPIVEVRA